MGRRFVVHKIKLERYSLPFTEKDIVKEAKLIIRKNKKLSSSFIVAILRDKLIMKYGRCCSLGPLRDILIQNNIFLSDDCITDSSSRNHDLPLQTRLKAKRENYQKIKTILEKL
jgi:hypothetical protein